MLTLLNVSNRLPITIGETISKSSGGLVAALEALPRDRFALEWIGWPGTEVADAPRRQQIAEALRQEFQAAPVWLTGPEMAGYYDGLSNASLWPVLHYMPQLMRYEPAWWDAYQAANQKFADATLARAKDGDLVWVHDYQLMLVPAMLRKARPELKIGFFLHTPFPAFEVFRCHPKRSELVAGVLGADLIGLHTAGYLRHFRTAAFRLLGHESELTRTVHDGRFTQLGVYPIGINAAKITKTLASGEYRRHLASLRVTHERQKVVLSVERLDYTKGLLHRLDAIDLYLSQAPDPEAIQFIFVAVPSRENVEEYQSLREEVEARIGRINGRYATLHASPIRFVHGSVEFAELCALYALADVALVTPLIDGMNLVAKEYAACQLERPGVLVLSEFAGAAEEMATALLVNPYDAPAVAAALGKALAMPEIERRARMEPMRQRVLQADACAWAQTFLDELAESPAPPAPPRTDLSPARQTLATALAARQRVGLYLDYDGTLRELEPRPELAVPTEEVRALLAWLQGRSELDVFVISGRSAADLEAWLGSYRLTLVAEHGAAVRVAEQGGWERLDENIGYEWRPDALRLLRLWESTTPGSEVEVKRSSLVWHYRLADPVYGAWKAKELAEELTALAANAPVRVRHGRQMVEITPTQISKSAIVGRTLRVGRYGAALVAGDDLTDEDMFRVAYPKLVTVKVGPIVGHTHAQYWLPTPAAFRAFLRDLPA